MRAVAGVAEATETEAATVVAAAVAAATAIAMAVAAATVTAVAEVRSALHDLVATVCVPTLWHRPWLRLTGTPHLSVAASALGGMTSASRRVCLAT